MLTTITPPLDITLQELGIETLLPANAASRTALALERWVMLAK